MNDLQVLPNMKEYKLMSSENVVKSLGKTVQKNVMRLKAAIALDTVLAIEGAICMTNALQKMSLLELMRTVLHPISHVQVIFFTLI